MLLLLICGGVGQARRAPAVTGVQAAGSAQPAAPEGMLVTSAATAESLDPIDAGTPAGGLVLQVTLANQTGGDVGGLRLRAPAPAQTHVTDSWLGQAGQAPGLVDSQAVNWSGLSIPDGARLGPFTFRVEPDAGADGATLFRAATLLAEVVWTDPGPGSASPLPLRLNGLWGEGGLRRTILSTGLTVFTRERPDTPTVALRLAVRAGARDEDAGTCGGSHWLEHAHFLGTATRPDNQAIFGPIANIGGQLNASTGHEATDYYDLVPADNIDVGLDVLADQMLNSTFRREAFNRERLVVIQEHSRRGDDPSVRALDEFLGNVFQVSPLRRNPGSVECLAVLPIETILSYRADHYLTGNMVIAASGNLRHDNAVARIEQALAGLPRGPRGDRPRVPEPVEGDPRSEVIGDGTQVAELQLGWPVAGDDGADWPALVVLRELLGNTGRRLASEIIDRRALATTLAVSYYDFSDAGALGIAVTTRPDRTGEVIDLALAQVQRLRAGEITTADVEAGQRAYSGRRSLAAETNLAETGIAEVEATGTLDSDAETLARLRGVTPADVQRVAQQYLDPENYTRVIVRP